MSWGQAGSRETDRDPRKNALAERIDRDSGLGDRDSSREQFEVLADDGHLGLFATS